MSIAVQMTDYVTPTFVPPSPHTGDREIEVRTRSGSVRGSFITSGTSRILHFESLLEKKVALCAMARPDVAEVHSQTPYVAFVDDRGKNRGHYFDLTIIKRDGTKIATAVRPAARVKEDGLLRDLELIAAQMSPDQANRVVLATEACVPTDAVHNASLIHAVRRDPPTDLDQEIAEIAGSFDEPFTIANLVAATGHGALAFRGAVRLIGSGLLRPTTRCRITYETPIMGFRNDEVRS